MWKTQGNWTDPVSEVDSVIEIVHSFFYVCKLFLALTWMSTMSPASSACTYRTHCLTLWACDCFKGICDLSFCLPVAVCHSSWDPPRYECERELAQWKKEIAFLYGGLSLIPTRLRRKLGMALCALNSCPGGQRQVDPLWPTSPVEKASDSLKDRLKVVESDRGRHPKASSALTCLCLSTCAHTVMCMHRGVTLSWEHRLEIKNMNLVVEQGSFQDVGS